MYECMEWVDLRRRSSRKHGVISVNGWWGSLGVYIGEKCGTKSGFCALWGFRNQVIYTFIVVSVLAHVTCKTLRLSVFNKELLTYLLAKFSLWNCVNNFRFTILGRPWTHTDLPKWRLWGSKNAFLYVLSLKKASLEWKTRAKWIYIYFTTTKKIIGLLFFAFLPHS